MPECNELFVGLAIYILLWINFKFFGFALLVLWIVSQWFGGARPLIVEVGTAAAGGPRPAWPPPSLRPSLLTGVSHLEALEFTEQEMRQLTTIQRSQDLSREWNRYRARIGALEPPS